MTPAKRQQIDRLIDRIARMLDGNVAAPMILAALIDEEGAHHRFVCGAYELRMAGIAGTSTVSVQRALESWMRAALRRIAKECSR